MTKIKGWKRIDYIFRDGSLHNVYISNKKRTIIAGKLVSIDGEKGIKVFKNKEQGLKYAVEYMRLHPKG